MAKSHGPLGEVYQIQSNTYQRAVTGVDLTLNSVLVLSFNSSGPKLFSTTISPHLFDHFPRQPQLPDDFLNYDKSVDSDSTGHACAAITDFKVQERFDSNMKGSISLRPTIITLANTRLSTLVYAGFPL